jgi:hypothetical protein
MIVFSRLLKNEQVKALPAPPGIAPVLRHV